MRHFFLHYFTIFFIGVSISHTTFANNNDIVLAFEDVRINKGDSQSATAYMHIINYSETQAVDLQKVEADIATSANLYKTKNGRLRVDAGDGFDMQDDTIHIRLDHLTQAISEGDVIPLTLHFAHGEAYIVDATVVKPGTHLHSSDDGEQLVHDDH